MVQPCGICGAAHPTPYRYRECCLYHEGWVCNECYWEHCQRDEGGRTCTAPLPFASPLESVEEMAAELRGLILEFST